MAVAFEIEFYEDERGNEPCRRWIEKDLTPIQRRALVAAIEHVLARRGIGVCGTSFGRHVTGAKGIFEFRVNTDAEAILKGAGLAPAAGHGSEGRRSQRIMLRVFCHAYGNKIILLLGGYDKGADPRQKRQRKEIAVARKRLARFLDRQREARKAAGSRRRGPSKGRKRR